MTAKLTRPQFRYQVMGYSFDQTDDYNWSTLEALQKIDTFQLNPVSRYSEVINGVTVSNSEVTLSSVGVYAITYAAWLRRVGTSTVRLNVHGEFYKNVNGSGDVVLEDSTFHFYIRSGHNASGVGSANDGSMRSRMVVEVLPSENIVVSGAWQRDSTPNEQDTEILRPNITIEKLR